MTDTQYFIMELTVGVIEMRFVLRYCDSVYGVSKYTKMIHLLSVPYILAVSVLLKIFVLQPHNSISLPFITVLAALVFLPFMPGRWEKRVLFGVMLTGVSIAWTFLADLITSLPELEIAWLNYLCAHAVFWLLLELLKRIGKKEHQYITGSMWLLLISVASLSVVVCCVLYADWFSSEFPHFHTSDFLMLTVFMLINAALFFIYDRFSTLLSEVKEQSLLEQQLFLQNDHFKDLAAYQKQISALHHDMRNYISAAVSLARSDNSFQLERYLETVSGKLERIEQTVTTGNTGIDSVLNLKIAQLKYADIRCETDIHIPSGLPLDFETCVTILGNLLDNAREACEKLPREKRWARVVMTYSGGALYIKADNAAESRAVPVKDDSLPQTTKPNKHIHGFGLKNIMQIIEHRGMMKIDRSVPGVFSVRVMLYGL